MESLISVTEDVCNARQVLVPDRYQQPFVDLYQNTTNNEMPERKDRKMSVISQGILFRWMRGRDIPQGEELASAENPNLLTVGLTGSEWCREYDSSKSYTSVIWDEMKDERIGKVSLIASVNSDISSIRSQLNDWSRPVQVVTAYPNLVRELRKDRKFNITPEVSISGGVEGVADMLGMAAVDLVSRGETIASNNFVVVQELLESYPAIVRVNRNKRIRPSRLRELESIDQVDFSKLIDPVNGEQLVPAIVIDDGALAKDGLKAIRMVGFMNRQALEKTIETGFVTFCRRKSGKLWTKGEESGNFLLLRAIFTDCDYDSLLIKALPIGQTCHNGVDSCFEEPDIGE